MQLDNAPNLDKPGSGGTKRPGDQPAWAKVVSWLILGVPVLLIGNCMLKNSANPAGDASEARVMCSSFIERRLRDPDSVQWIDRPSWPATKADNGAWSVRAAYRARNGFGGMNVESHECLMWKASGQWTAVQ